MPRTETADIQRMDWYIVARIDADVAQSPDDARANLATAIALSGAERLPLLLDISRCLPLTAQARQVFTGDSLHAFRAIAIIIEASALGRMMGNVYLRIAQPGPRTQLFTSEATAIAWLQRTLL